MHSMLQRRGVDEDLSLVREPAHAEECNLESRIRVVGRNFEVVDLRFDLGCLLCATECFQRARHSR